MNDKSANNSANNSINGEESQSTANRQRYLAAGIATALMEGLTLDEIKNLYAIVLLTAHNIQAEITLRGLYVVTPIGGSVIR